MSGMEYPAKGTIFAPWERWRALSGVVVEVALVAEGTGPALAVVMLGGGVCSAVTGVPIPERSMRVGVVWRALTMTPWQEDVHALGINFGTAMNARLLKAAPRAGAARGTRLRDIVGL